MTSLQWVLTIVGRSIFTAAVVWLLGGPLWASFLGAVIVAEAATAARAAGRRAA